MSEYRALADHVNRLIAAVPVLGRNLAAKKAPAPTPATRHKATTATEKKRTRRADQETAVMPAIQLSFLWYGEQDRAEGQGAG